MQMSTIYFLRNQLNDVRIVAGFQVRDLLGRCTCPQTFPMHRVAEGKYQIGDSLTVIFVRVSETTSNT